MARPFMKVVPVLVACALAGCGGDTRSGGPDVACSNYATAYCNKFNQCAPFLMGANYGTVATCVSAERQQCVDRLTANGTTWTAAGLTGCTQAVNAIACADFVNASAPPPACRPTPGTLTRGALCLHDAQCMTRRCLIVGASVCGQCISEAAVGQSCTQMPCEYGLACVPTSMTAASCVRPGGAGAGCDAARPCANGLRCVGSAGATTCQPSPASMGAPCTPRAAGACDAARGFGCSTASNTCQAIGLANVGQPCNLVNGGLVVCRGGGLGSCRLPSMTAQTGTCQPLAAVGQPCDVLAGSACQPPAECLNSGDGGSRGTCQVVTSALCR